MPAPLLNKLSSCKSQICLSAENLRIIATSIRNGVDVYEHFCLSTEQQDCETILFSQAFLALSLAILIAFIIY